MLNRFDLPLAEQLGEELFLEKFIVTESERESAFYDVRKDSFFKACTKENNAELPGKPSVEDGFLKRSHSKTKEWVIFQD